MKHQYVDATTNRYREWLAQRAKDNYAELPRLDEIERWLGEDEEYRDPLRALSQLCVGLREAKQPGMIQWIACELISELESERAFGRKAESFFSAMISRCGVEDFDVVMFDKSHRKCGTLHDHHTQETANAQD
jgi:hypothetical protein